MKRKLGETLCSLLVTMSMILGLIPGISLTVHAEPTEELLTTITATGKEQASYSTENVATVSFSYTANGASSYIANWGWWGYGWIATVTPADGYTITKCVFYDDANRTATDSEAPFVVETTEEDKTPQVNGAPILAYRSKGITKIEVYGYANTVDTPSAAISPENSGTVSVTFDSASNNWIFTASPAEGYVFDKWTFLDDGDPNDDESNPLTVDRSTFSNWANFTAVFEEATYTVTYSVVNGTWSDGTTADKTETVQSGSAPASVPSGMIADSGFTGGSWDTDPSSATITGDTTFTYTFEAIPTYTVTYSVVNGTWSDGTTADKTETVQSGSAPASVPSGMIADSGFTGGSWDTDPSSATITGDATFTYTFEAESVNPDTPTPDPDPVTPDPDPEPVTPSDTPAPVITPEQAREMTIRHFVERIYLIALNRSYDVSGRDYWVDQITNKDASGSAIARGFFNSQEFIARELDNEEFINILYRVFFDRDPDTQGFANWINALENGATRSEVINGFTGSTEWTSMCARFGINA